MAHEPTISLDDPRYLKALAHPLRIRILAMLGERAASPVQLANRVDASLGAVAYHVRTLHKLGLVELVETHQRRGATEHVYRALEQPRFSDEAWEGLGAVAKQRLLGAMLRQIGEYVSASAAAGGFDRSDANISRLGLRVDEQGWAELARATKRWLADVDRIEESVAKRRERNSSTEQFDVGLVLMLFRALPFSELPPEPPGTRRGASARGRTARTSASRSR